MSETETDLAAYLRDNPRMTGVLFTLLLVLTQAGNAAGAAGTSLSGP